MSFNLFEALAHVQEIQRRLITNKTFFGYSGVARAAGGCIALLGGIVMSLPFFPTTPAAHIIGWGSICALAFMVNYAGLLLWFVRQPVEERKLVALCPAIDAAPPLIVGGILTFALLKLDASNLLFGMWMCLFGLVNISSRYCLPKEISYLGCFYIACGAYYFFGLQDPNFLNPWPMALVFFSGEVFGGYLFHRQRTGNE